MISMYPFSIFNIYHESTKSADRESKTKASTVTEGDLLIKEVGEKKIREAQESKGEPFSYSDEKKSSPRKIAQYLPNESVSKGRFEHLITLPSHLFDDKRRSLATIITEIDRASKELETPINPIPVLAEWINYGNVKLSDLSFFGLSKIDIKKIAPFLTHMNLCNLEFQAGWTAAEVQELIASAAPNLVSLFFCNAFPLTCLPKVLPKLQEFSCSHSDLKDLPIYPELRKLDCACCHMSTLPLYPNLEELDCSNCAKLTELPVYPKLTKLICNNCLNLEGLPEYPKLKELRCENCYKLTTIPMQPELRFLYCNSCNGLTELPTFPKLETLYCCYCRNLSKLPACPSLQLLGCIECKRLTRLPSYPVLKKLYCSYCRGLTKLPSYPLLEELECLLCIGLTVVPKYKNLKKGIGP